MKAYFVYILLGIVIGIVILAVGTLSLMFRKQKQKKTVDKGEAILDFDTTLDLSKPGAKKADMNNIAEPSAPLFEIVQDITFIHTDEIIC